MQELGARWDPFEAIEGESAVGGNTTWFEGHPFVEEIKAEGQSRCETVMKSWLSAVTCGKAWVEIDGKISA